MRSAGRQLTERYQLFRLHHLRLQALQVLNRRFRTREQACPVGVRQMHSQKNQQRKRQRGNQRRHETEVANRRRVAFKAQGIERQQRQRQNGGHREPSGPGVGPPMLSIAFHRQIELLPVSISEQPGEAIPEKRGHQRKIVKAPGVVSIARDGQIERQRCQRIKRRGPKKVQINRLPCPSRPQPEEPEPRRRAKLLQVRQKVVIEVVGFKRRRRVQPR